MPGTGMPSSFLQDEGHDRKRWEARRTHSFPATNVGAFVMEGSVIRKVLARGIGRRAWR